MKIIYKMLFTVITYDVDRGHIAVKKAMIEKGYLKSWTSRGGTYYLPNTTLWKKDGAIAKAIKDIKEVCQSLRVSLLRAVAVVANDWNAIEGSDFD